MHMHRRKVICTGYAAVASSKDCAGIASALDEMPRMMKHARSETLAKRHVRDWRQMAHQYVVCTFRMSLM